MNDSEHVEELNPDNRGENLGDVENVTDIKQSFPASESHNFDPSNMIIGPDGLPVEKIQPSEGMDQHDIAQEAEVLVSYEEHESKQPLLKRVGRFATIMTLLNSCLGIGILQVPNSFVNTGIFLSLIILIIVAIISYYATVLVLDLQSDLGVSGFDELALKLTGRIGSISLSVLTLLFLKCGLLSYMIIAGDMILSWLELAKIDFTGLWKRALLIFIYSVCIPIALTIPRNISFLSYFSMATMVCITIFIVSLIVKLGLKIKASGVDKTVKYFKTDITMFQTLSIFGLTFCLPVVCLPIVKLYNPLPRKRHIVALVAVIICSIFVFLSGICGYLIFGDKVDANVLNSFDSDVILIIVVRALFFIVVSCAFPVICQSVLGSWAQLIFKVNDASMLSAYRRSIVLIISTGIPLIIAMFLSTAKPALSVGGALGGCVVNFMYPGLLSLYADKPIFQLKHTPQILLVLFGFVSGCISTYISVIDAIKSFKA